LVGAGGSFVADVEPAKLVKPGEGALDDPADAAEAGTVFGLPTRDQRFDSERSELAAVELVVVATIGDQLPWPSLRPAGSAGHRRDRV
jgi:hypothetical protein